MAEHDISLVTAQAGSVIAEGNKVTLGTASAALTPSTITAIAGLAKGGALQVAPAVNEAINKIQESAASAFSAAGGNAAILSASGVSLTSVATSATDITNRINSLSAAATSYGVNISGATSLISASMTAATNLSLLTQKMIPAGNPAAFGQLLLQAQSHIKDSIDLNSAAKFIKECSFGDLGTGVSDMKSAITRGLDSTLGDLKSAASAFSSAGPAFDLGDIPNFGSSAGLTNKLSSLKLGNASGVNDLLQKNGVDLKNLTDPVYTDTMNKVMSSVTDPGVLSTITKQMGIGEDVAKNITKLSDLSDVKKLVPADVLTPKIPALGGITASSIKSITNLNSITPQLPSVGLTADLSSMASKLSDMGAKFASPSAAANMLKNIKIPSIPNLNTVPSLASLMASHAPDLASITGSGSGPLGAPSMTDFMQAVAGGPMITNILANGASPAAIAQIESMVINTKSLISKMGVDIDIDPPTPKSLSSIIGFATSLHKLGADASGSGAANILERMVTPDQYGDAIKASLAEGKNNAVMAANNISQPKYEPVTPPPVDNIAKRKEIDDEYENYSNLVYNSGTLAYKKQYTERLVNEVIPSMIEYYNSTKDSYFSDAEAKMGRWQNYLTIVNKEIAAGGL